MNCFSNFKLKSITMLLSLSALPTLVMSIAQLAFSFSCDPDVCECWSLLRILCLVMLAISVVQAVVSIGIAVFFAAPLGKLSKSLIETFSETEQQALVKISFNNDFQLVRNSIGLFCEKGKSGDFGSVNSDFDKLANCGHEIFFRVRGEKFSSHISPYWYSKYGDNLNFDHASDFKSLVAPESIEQYKCFISNLKSSPNQQIQTQKIRIKIAENRIITVKISAFSRNDRLGNLEILGAISDIEIRISLESQANEYMQRYDFVMQSVPDVIYDVDVKANIYHILNPEKWAELCDIKLENDNFELSRKKYWDYIHPDYREDFLDRFLNYDHLILQHDNSLTFEYRLKAKTSDNDWIWVEHSVRAVAFENGRVIRVIGQIANINEKKRREYKKLYRSEHDSLTGAFLHSVIKREFAAAVTNAAHRNEQPVMTILLVDIDNFNEINEQFGFRIGDLALRYVVSIIWAAQISKCDVGRSGYDEFIIITKKIPNTNYDPPQIADLIISHLSEPVKLEDKYVNLTVSIGSAEYGSDGCDFDQLFCNAETALQHARKLGRNNYLPYSTEMVAAEMERTPDEIENDILNKIDYPATKIDI